MGERRRRARPLARGTPPHAAQPEGATYDVLTALQRLRTSQARRAAAHARTLPGLSLEEQIRAAIQFAYRDPGPRAMGRTAPS